MPIKTPLGTVSIWDDEAVWEGVAATAAQQVTVLSAAERATLKWLNGKLSQFFRRPT